MFEDFKNWMEGAGGILIAAAIVGYCILKLMFVVDMGDTMLFLTAVGVPLVAFLAFRFLSYFHGIDCS